jgi:hypothetical protein
MSAYIVTVRLRAQEEKPAQTITRKWTAAVDAADAIELTFTHFSHADRSRVERVLVVEDNDPLDDAIEENGGGTWL